MALSSLALIRLLILFPIVFVGALLTLYGETRRGVLFGVTISLDYARSRRSRASLRNYRLQVLAFALADLLLSAFLIWTPVHILIASIFVAIFAVPTELVAAWLLWRYHARLVLPHAAIVPLQRHSELLPPSTTTPIIATVLSLLPLGLTTLFLDHRFNQLPSRWPIHWDINGVANGWATRDFPGVFTLDFVGVASVLLLLGISLFMMRTSGPESLQRHRTLVPLAALSWLLAVFFSFLSLVPLLHTAPDGILLVAGLIFFLVFGVAGWLIYRVRLIPGSSTLPYNSTPHAA